MVSIKEKIAAASAKIKDDYEAERAKIDLQEAILMLIPENVVSLVRRISPDGYGGVAASICFGEGIRSHLQKEPFSLWTADLITLSEAFPIVPYVHFDNGCVSFCSQEYIDALPSFKTERSNTTDVSGPVIRLEYHESTACNDWQTGIKWLTRLGGMLVEIDCDFPILLKGLDKFGTEPQGPKPTLIVDESLKYFKDSEGRTIAHYHTIRWDNGGVRGHREFSLYWTPGFERDSITPKDVAEKLLILASAPMPEPETDNRANIAPTGRIPKEALAVLSAGTSRGNEFHLPEGELPETLYRQVAKVLEALGGKWKGGKVRAHVFPDNPAERIENAILTGDYKKFDTNPYELFETSDSLADRMVKLLNPQSTDFILEPSAGRGQLIAAVLRSDAIKLQIFACEINPALAQSLRDSFPGHIVKEILERDFTQYDAPCLFHGVIMNPPFSNQQDIDHVLRAFSFLRPGGRLVAIMAAATLWRNTKKAEKFREFLAANGRYEENPEGSFKAAGTNVDTITVVLNRK